MPTAKKLKSGSWRCQVYSHTEEILQPDGTIKKKIVKKSFTCDDTSAKGKRKCEQMAATWAVEREETQKYGRITFNDAMTNYIASRENILSPRTISDYLAIQKNYLANLKPRDLYSITQSEIQNQINLESAHLSPKTVRNIYGLLSVVFATYRPDFALRTVLPKNTKPNIYVPSDDDIKAVIGASKGTDMELPILLAAFGPMRRGEICALTSDDITGNIVHVHLNMVKNKEKQWVLKSPKSYEGDRYINYPNFVAEKFKNKKGRIVEITPDVLTSHWNRLLKRNNLQSFRFHDLRHYSASIQHALGVPDSYIMKRGGWGNDRTLKTVYRHVLEEKVKQMDMLTNDYFEKTFPTKLPTK